jgi:aminoglycoside phosphotransferase (APT) family kinase protein
VPEGIRDAAVTAWFEAHVPGVRPPLSFELIVGGRSNLTYRVEDARGERYVLRRPPLGALLETAHDVGREHRIISALADSGVPVAPALGLCRDTGVNDAPFYVMAFVDGSVMVAPEDAAILGEAQRERLGYEVVEVLARLHALDPAAVGLDDLGKHEGYIERQLRRWSRQWERSRTREVPAMEETYAALSARIPVQQGSGIVHGDFRLGNMIVSDTGHAAAVLDWELCTLGDRLADLGYLINDWGPAPIEGLLPTSPTSARGFPSIQAITAHYAELSGLDTSALDYYRAFQHWRLAAIVEGVLARFEKGVMGQKTDTAPFRDRVDALAAAALDHARRL